MEVMTMTEPLTHPAFGQPWTIHDLDRLPNDEMRYEIVDGSLLVSPRSGVRHFRVSGMLRNVLATQAPDDLFVGESGYLSVKGGASCFLPDVMVVRRAALEFDDEAFKPADVPLVVEVLSPSNRGNDLVLKRHYYAAGGIPHYWIVDPDKRTLTVFTLDGDSYAERAVVGPGQVWESTEPFPLRIDPGEFT
jgi:Uma2 family endonuclease